MAFYNDVIFPRFYDFVIRHGAFDKKRTGALANVKGKILEIGIGTGLNLDRYPLSVKEITAIEPNPGMEKEFRKKAAHHRLKVDFHSAGAEQMPFKNEEFDTVVSTITLCSIPKLQGALHEILRVLKPGGQFLFLDHGLSSIKSVARVQNFLNPVQMIVGAGCKLTLDIESELKRAGFEIKEISKYQLENAPKFIGSVYEGRATKA